MSYLLFSNGVVRVKICLEKMPSFHYDNILYDIGTKEVIFCYYCL